MKPDLTPEQLKRVRAILNQDDPPFVFVPSSDFRQLIARGGHHIADQLPEKIKVAYLSGQGLRIDKEMVMKWLDETLDEKNAFMLNNGSIVLEKEAAWKVGKEVD